ncbi:hypothetical protein ACNJYD_14835 [Bradyrhizobium sp. DASA03005]|uniref:hypothetical protein n=1 Tax=Bradyrhizobium sp. SPXBL-02 TaxID=3395912 RepID=UPI003F6EA037
MRQIVRYDDPHFAEMFKFLDRLQPRKAAGQYARRVDILPSAGQSRGARQGGIDERLSNSSCALRRAQTASAISLTPRHGCAFLQEIEFTGRDAAVRHCERSEAIQNSPQRKDSGLLRYARNDDVERARLCFRCRAIAYD